MVRPRVRDLLLLAVAAACCWVAAPALSSQRYMPEAVDFEQALGPVRASARLPAARLDRPSAPAGAGPVSYRSGVVAAPRRFDLVGLARELRPIEIRAREGDGEWSDWTETANGDPIYFGGADELQLRTRGWRPRGTLHYVNVSGDTSMVGGLVTKAREALNSAFVSTSSVLASEADALPVRPTIIGRTAWGANRSEGGCKPRERPQRGVVKAAVVHHTVTANDYSEAEAPGIVLGICRYHRNANGWNDIGYNALVDRFGNIYAGRAGGLQRAIVGAHAQGFNSETTGVASIGTHTTAPISRPGEDALVDFLAWKLAYHGLQATGKTTLRSAGGELSLYPAGRRVRLKKIIGHQDVGRTSCPGGSLEDDLARLRRKVQARIEAGGGPAPTEPPQGGDGGGGVTPK